MTDTPRDQGDDLRERQFWGEHDLNVFIRAAETRGVDITASPEDLRAMVKQHTDVALAEQREQIVAALERESEVPGLDWSASGALQHAAEMVSKVGEL